MSNSLLPPSASDLERRLAAACEGISHLSVPLRDIWNPRTCPLALLPYLAWSRSVDRWDESWPEAVKRQVVIDAFYVHKQKGTISAIRRVVEPFGFLLRVTEWWQESAQRGTFRLDIGVEDQGISEETYQELERLISDAKPRSRHLAGLSINLQSTGNAYCAAGCYMGDTLTVYPYFPETVEVGGSSYAGASVHITDTVRISVDG